MYNVTVLIRKLTKALTGQLLHIVLLRWRFSQQHIMGCFVCANKPNREKLKLTYEQMGGTLCNHSNTKFDRVTVFIVSVTRPSNLDC